MERSLRNLEIVRQTAELLASGSDISETFERLCNMLAQFIDCELAFIAIVDDEGEPFLEYAYDQGVHLRKAHIHIKEGAQTRRVLENGNSLRINAITELDSAPIPLRVPGGRDEDTQSALFVPLRVGRNVLGVLSVQSKSTHVFSDEDLRLLETCALYVAVAVQAERVKTEHSLDAVTGVPTRRIFNDRMQDDWARARRDGTTIAMLLLDVDFFKRFNDTYGHVAGDACLRQVAQAARGVLSRDTDTFARYGGEEFTALLWATDAAGALATAERMREAVAFLAIPHVESPTGHVSVSIGVACTAPSSSAPEELMRAADRALYAAKTSGRDRVVVDQFESVQGKSARTITNNLRPATTSFLGRATEVTAVLEALQTARLVTIVGPGGMGKTRTAIATAQRRLYTYLDGVWFIDFHGVNDPEFVDGAVATVLGISQRGGGALREALLAELAKSNMLLIFDNCEHLVAPIARLSEAIVEVAPNVNILATSRERLRAKGEHPIALAALDGVTAAELFSERARAAYPPFTIADADSDAINAILAKLDFLPLAIELAAPRVKSMTLTELLASLEDRFRVLVSTSRKANDPHRALLAAIEWSFDLLDAQKQHLLENISVFPAAIDGDAMRDVCSDDVIEPWDLADALNDLVEKNLVSVHTATSGERFTLLESTREFAHLRLAKRPDASGVAQRHIRYYRSVAKRIGEQIGRSSIEATISLATGEWDNLRGALERALRDRLDPSSGRSMVLSLSQYWKEAGRLSEGAYWCKQALDTVTDDVERSELLYAAALIAHSQGDFGSLGTLAEQLVAIHERGADIGALARSYNALGNARFKTGNPEEAVMLYRKALEHYRLGSDKRGVAVALMNLGSVIADWKLDYNAAREYFEESLTIFRGFGTSANAGIVLANLGEVAHYEGHHDQAISYATESLAIFERLGNKALAAWQLLDIARYNVELGNLDDANRSLRLARRYLNEEPANEHHVGFFESAFHLAFASGARELAAKICGYLDRYRREHRQPRAPSDVPPFDSRFEKLQASFDAKAFALLTKAGALAEANALQDELEALTS